MKTFKDLQFKPHKNSKGSVAAFMEFDNGSWISVVGGKDTFLKGNGTTSFEIMSNVTENTEQGVETWLTPGKITQRMRWLQIRNK